MNGASDSLQAVREITVQTEVARCRICEKVRGMSPEDAMEVMAVELNAAGINVRVISGPDAARVDQIHRETGVKVRRDWEGADPLKCLMEAYFMMSVEPLDEVMDGNVSFSGRKCSALSVSERLAILHGAAEGYDLRGELRTAGFRKGLKDSVEKSGFRLDMEYSDPMPLKGGRTENCVQQDCRLRITDLVNDRLIWSGCASVVEEGTDAARMRALRSVLEAAGFFSPLDRSGDIRTGRYEGFHSPIDWTGEKYLQ